MSRRIPLVALLVLSAVIAISPALAAGGNSKQFKVTSTLDGKTVLPQRIHWIARPHIAASKVEEVDFLIDGRLGWVEHNAPYVYGNDGNWLVTSTLKPGRHTFTVRTIAFGFKKASDTVKAMVVEATTPPAELAGTWSRTATIDDLKKCTTEAEGGCPPTGKWSLTIGSRGWAVRDPQNGGGLFDAMYLGDGRVQMRPTIEYAPYPNANNGGWCSDTDPLAIWTASAASDGSTLQLDPLGTDPCGDRTAILEGTWTRVV